MGITATTGTAVSHHPTMNTSVGSEPLQDATSRQHLPKALPDVTFPLQTLTKVDNPDIVNIQLEGDVPSSQNQDLEDSDTTNIYNPDDVVVDKKKRVFTTVTCGIKITKHSRCTLVLNMESRRQVYN